MPVGTYQIGETARFTDEHGTIYHATITSFTVKTLKETKMCDTREATRTDDHTSVRQDIWRQAYLENLRANKEAPACRATECLEAFDAMFSGNAETQ